MNWDTAAFRFINIELGADALAPVMKALSSPGFFAPIILIAILWMVFKDGGRGRWTVLALILVILAGDQLSSHVLKPLVNRPRPCRPEVGIEGVKTHGARCSSRGSFPSSHATNIAATMLILAWRYRRMTLVAILIAFAVGYSRIYLGVHYPADVLGGWAIGGGLGFGFSRGLRWRHRRFNTA